MNKLTLFCALAVVLTGCQSPSFDMANNQFVAINPQPLPAEAPGVWTGNMGPYTTTLQWQADGRGLICHSWGESNTVQRIKFASGHAYIEDGTHLNLVGTSTQAITLSSPYGVGQETVLRPDNGYQNASLYCADALRHYAGADTPPT